MPPPWTFEWLTDWDAVWQPDLLKSWRPASRTSMIDPVFTNPALVRAWCETASLYWRVEPRFCLATRQNGLHVLLPLVRLQTGIKELHCRTLMPAGADVFDYHPPIILNGTLEPAAETEFWQAASQEIKRTRTQNAHRLFYPGIIHPPTGTEWSQTDLAPRIQLTVSQPEAVLNQLKRSLRGDLRRQQRRVEEETGTIRYCVLDPNDDQTITHEVEAILDQHRQRWPRSFHLPGFHQALVRAAAREGLLHLSQLWFGDQVVSRHLGFATSAIFYWYLPVFDPEFTRFSPGKLHLLHFLQDAAALGVQTVDLLRGDEPYKKQWATPDKTRALFTLERWTPGPASAIRRHWCQTIKPALARKRPRLSS